jgi:mannose-6-phosphate isomerase-like protein (cupin superfamily)
MLPETRYRLLIDRIRSLLNSLRAGVPERFLVGWPDATELRRVVPSPLPVLQWLPKARADAPPLTVSLVDAVCDAATCMDWQQSYSATEIGPGFLERYGWTEIVGLRGPLASTRMACGFLLLGPETHYPRHRHEAEEIYIPLSGTASWQQDDGDWRQLHPGTVIRHASDEPHAMRTSGCSLLAVYLWRSSNLQQKSKLD